MKLSHDKKYLFALLISVPLLALVFTWGEPIYRAGYIISHIVPGAPRLFEWGKYDVSVKRVEIPGGKVHKGVLNRDVTNQTAYLYLPEGLSRPAFVILVPGFTPEGALDVRLVNLANAFAGSGIGVATPDSDTIRKKQFSRSDIDLIKSTFFFLRNSDFVDKERIGICGFSVAGSYALRAAAELDSKPLFVFSLGGYFNLAELIVQVLSKTATYNGESRAWEPDAMPKEVINDNFMTHLGKNELETIDSQELTYKDASTYLQSLPQEIMYTLDNLSPAPTLSMMRTAVFLMHDRYDEMIPVEESRKIRDALPKDTLLHYTELSIIRHVNLDNFFNREILKFSWHVLNMVKILI